MAFVPPASVNANFDLVKSHAIHPQPVFPQTCIPAPCSFEFAAAKACESMATQLRAAARALRQPQSETCNHLPPLPGILSLEHVPKKCNASEAASESTKEDSGESSPSSEDLSPEEIKKRAPWRKWLKHPPCRTVACH